MHEQQLTLPPTALSGTIIRKSDGSTLLSNKGAFLLLFLEKESTFQKISCETWKRLNRR